MPKRCPGSGCSTDIADDMEFCTSCNREFEQSVAANFEEIQLRLLRQRQFDAWLAAHPEHE